MDLAIPLVKITADRLEDGESGQKGFLETRHQSSKLNPIDTGSVAFIVPDLPRLRQRPRLVTTTKDVTALGDGLARLFHPDQIPDLPSSLGRFEDGTPDQAVVSQ